MDTRGSAALVVFNIGHDIGILTPMIFTILVLVTIFTTMMTCSLLRLFGIFSVDTPQPGTRSAAASAIGGTTIVNLPLAEKTGRTHQPYSPLPRRRDRETL